MGLKDNFFKMVQNIFGSKNITDVKELDSARTDLDSAINQAENSGVKKTSSEFEDSLKPENMQQSAEQEPKGVTYSEISKDIKPKLLASFEEFKSAVLSKQQIEEEGYLQEGKEGEVEGKPFISYVTVSADGKLQSTIIVTENSISKTTQKEDGEYEYQETRKTRNGTKTVVTHGNRTLQIEGDVSQARIEELKKFVGTSERLLKQQPKSAIEAEKDVYTDALNSLGVDTKLDIDEKEKYAVGASGHFAKNSNKEAIVTWIYSKDNKKNNPESIVFATQENGRLQSKTFRRMENGNYIDMSTFKIKDGKPEYAEIPFSSVLEYGKKVGLGIEIKNMKKHRKFVNQNEGKEDAVPDVAKEVYDNESKERSTKTEVKVNELNAEKQTIPEDDDIEH